MSNIEDIIEEEIEKVKPILQKSKNIYWNGTTQFNNILETYLFKTFEAKFKTLNLKDILPHCLFIICNNNISQTDKKAKLFTCVFKDGLLFLPIQEAWLTPYKPFWAYLDLHKLYLEKGFFAFEDVETYEFYKDEALIEFDLINVTDKFVIRSNKLFFNEINIEITFLELLINCFRRDENENSKLNDLVNEYKKIELLKKEIEDTSENKNQLVSLILNQIELCEKVSYLDANNTFWLGNKAKLLNSINKINEAKRTIKNALELFKTNNQLIDNINNLVNDVKQAYCELKITESEIFEKNEEYEQALWSLQESINDSLSFNELEDKKEKSNQLYLKVIEEIENKPYNSRKVIFVNEELPNIKPNTIYPIKSSYYGKLNFQPSHPVVNSLYIGHPYKSDVYLPFEDYEDILFQSQVMELSILLKSLGATKIRTEYIVGTESNTSSELKTTDNQNQNFELNAGVGTKLVSIDNTTNISNINNKHTESNSNSEHLNSKMMTIDGTFTPIHEPSIPEGLIWFKHIELWQNIAKQRLEGGLNNYQITISTKNVEQVSERELKNIDDEYKYLLELSGGTLITKAHTSINNENKSNSSFESLVNMKKQNSKEMKIYIEFESFNQKRDLQIEDRIDNTNLEYNLKYLKDEEDYISLLKECLEDNNEISGHERKLLNKLRDKLNITEERASELENSLLSIVQYSSEELEYISDLKECLVDNNEISGHDRKLLNKLRDKLNINEERAIQLEEILFKINN